MPIIEFDRVGYNAYCKRSAFRKYLCQQLADNLFVFCLKLYDSIFYSGIIGCFTRFFLGIARFRDVFYTFLLIFGGKVIPVEMLPEALKNIIKFTPIPYIFDLPVNLFSGRATFMEILIQGLWTFILGVLFNIIYKLWIKDNIESFS